MTGASKSKNAQSTNTTRGPGRPRGGKNPPNSKNVGRPKKRDAVDPSQVPLSQFGFNSPSSSASSSRDLVNVDDINEEIWRSNVDNAATNPTEPNDEAVVIEQSDVTATESSYMTLAELLLSNEDESVEAELPISDETDLNEEEINDTELTPEDRADGEQRESALRNYSETLQKCFKEKDGDEPQEYKNNSFWVNLPILFLHCVTVWIRQSYAILASFFGSRIFL